MYLFSELKFETKINASKDNVYAEGTPVTDSKIYFKTDH